jgi:hypothetical protein
MDLKSGKHYREQWREERMFKANVENHMIIKGKKSEHFQTFKNVTTGKCGIPLNVHIMVIVELVRVKGGDNSGMQYSYIGIELL